MPAAKKYPKVCDDCGASYEGILRQKRCDICAVEHNRRESRGGGERKARPAVKVCQDCAVEFVGNAWSKVCSPCGAIRLREANRVRKAAAWERLKAKRAEVPAPKLPPPCQRCHYCHETDQYPSGMVCLAEAFMRCQPWNLGAKPLKERENV